MRALGLNPVIIPKYPSANTGSMPVRSEMRQPVNALGSLGFKVPNKMDKLPPLQRKGALFKES